MSRACGFQDSGGYAQWQKGTYRLECRAEMIHEGASKSSLGDSADVRMMREGHMT